MWGRVIEIMIAVWIALSPFIFRAQDDLVVLWADQVVAAAIVLLAALSYWSRLRYAHLGSLFIALALIIWGRTSGSPPPPIHQNHIVIGLLLMMIAIIPNDASMPHEVWSRERLSP